MLDWDAIRKAVNAAAKSKEFTTIDVTLTDSLKVRVCGHCVKNIHNVIVQIYVKEGVLPNVTD